MEHIFELLKQHPYTYAILLYIAHSIPNGYQMTLVEKIAGAFLKLRGYSVNKVVEQPKSVVCIPAPVAPIAPVVATEVK